MRIRTLLLILSAIAVTAVAAVVALVVPRPASAPPFTPPASRDVAYAYTTIDDLTVVRGNIVVAKVPVILSLSSTVAWSNDGAYIAALPEAGDDADKLLLVNTVSGQVTKTSCLKCGNLTAFAEHSFLVIGDPGTGRQFLRYDPGPATDGRPVSLPANPDDEQPIFGSRTDLVLQNDYMTHNTNHTALRIISTSGNSDSLVNGDFVNGAIHVASDLGTHGEEQFLIAHDGSGCASSPRISIAHLDGTTRATDLSAAQPADHTFPTGVTVDDLWLGPDASFYASIGSWKCTKTQQETTWFEEMQTPAMPISLWKLDPNTLQWTNQHAVPALMTRFLGNSAMLSLAVPDCIGPHPYMGINTDYCRAGPLYKVANGKRTHIADHVTAIYTEPPPILP
ncbi:hypothetical protein [Nocardia nova]|uniref:hypothetical protein n=1 Tax=Nocardia nova TaxID=37330 RepID=UPI0007A42D21|nr:hypothetical protein [Nocardia nova]